MHKSAVLCFYRQPQLISSCSQAKIYFVVGYPGDVEFEKYPIYGPLSYQVEALIEQVDKFIRKISFIASDGTRQEIEDIDSLVIRELVSNAVAHRDYNSTGNIIATITEEMFEIKSPGSFPSETSWDSLINSPSPISIPKDAAIAQYLSHLITFEGIGRGFSIFKEYIRINGDDSIIYNELPGEFTCIRVLRRRRLNPDSSPDELIVPPNHNAPRAKKLIIATDKDISPRRKEEKAITRVPENDRKAALITSVNLENLTQLISQAPAYVGRLARKEIVFKILRALDLDAKIPPTDFSGIYAYSLVTYGVGKPSPIIDLFREPAIESAFRHSFEQQSIDSLLREGESFIDWNILGDQLEKLGFDPRREFSDFSSIFLEVALRSRMPAEVLRDQKIDHLQHRIEYLLERQAQLLSLEDARILFATHVTSNGQQFAATSQDAVSKFILLRRLRAWFEMLGYQFEAHQLETSDAFELILNIPARRRYDRILVRGIESVAEVRHVQALQAAVEEHRTDEGWLVVTRRISRAARDYVAEYEQLQCFTFDELLDEEADFTGYLDWLEKEIEGRGINQYYVPLACRKAELDPLTQQTIAESVYDERDGWIDRYIDQWLDDPVKEHISVLGEFGTGKTWFTLHYAWKLLQDYRKAKAEGVERPRLPLVIPLRDYAKAVSVESLFSEFFFRKHQIPLAGGYAAFELLNRMGKLLLIFDGFDEMADRVDRQKMINNFWELAKVVVPGAKAILTCRTEHFPEAQEWRRLLNAELLASTANLTGEPPQFEVLELEKFTEAQIRQVLAFRAGEETIERVMGNPQLLDLARRPVMTDLILDALPEIEAGKPIDLARVYLYAVRHKMETDIRAERTFTSLADKLYFLCELSWEMLETDQMSLNYRMFPERLRRLFGAAVQEQKDLDHWHYDMMGQTVLTRNEDGDYAPAHRSLLEFFVAYKLVAQLGVLAPDFTALAQAQSVIDAGAEPQAYTWSDYFRRPFDAACQPLPIAPLATFAHELQWENHPFLTEAPLAKAVLDLAFPMLDPVVKRERLLGLVQGTRGQSPAAVKYWGGNLVQLLLANDLKNLEDSDLHGTVLKGVNFGNASLRQTDFSGAMITDSAFTKVLAGVNSVTLSSDGQWLAIGEGNGGVQLWEVRTLKVLWMGHEHQRAVNSVAFSPDGNTIATGSYDKTVKLWSVTSGECVSVLAGHQNGVRSVVFSPDGKLLASGSDDKTVKLWSVTSGECVGTLAGHQNEVLSVAFSPDGSTIASGSDDSTIKLWSVISGEYVSTLAGHQHGVRSVAFGPDGKLLASGSDDKTVKLWSVTNGECVSAFAGHQNWVLSVAFSPDGKLLASGSYDKTVKLWSITSGKCVRTLAGHQNWVLSVTFSPDGNTITSGSYDKTVKLWSVASGECVSTFAGHQNWVLSVTFSPDGKLFASGSDDNTVKLWSVTSGECVGTFAGHQNWVRSVAFSPDGKLLASGSDDNMVKLWSVTSGECVGTLAGHENWVLSVTFSPNGNTIASSSYDKTVKLWSVTSGECVGTFAGHQNWVLSVAFSPDGNTIASGGDDQTVKLWSVTNGECVSTLTGHQNGVRSVTFSPTGNTIASGSSDRTVKLWSLPSGECMSTLAEHHHGVVSVAFSPDGKLLATSSDDKTVKLWSLPSGECVNTLEGHQDWVRSVAFSPDGNTIVSGSNDETIRFWQSTTGKAIRVLEDKLCTDMKIKDVQGLTEAQKVALRALGAVE